MRRNQPQDDADKRARDAELRQIRDATNALRGLTRAVGGGAGGGLVGAIGALGGVGGAIGGGVLGIVSEMVAEMRRISERTDRETGTIIRTQVATGGTSRDIAQTAGEFRAIGLDSSRIAQIADEFRERVFSDKFAVGAFGRQVLPERFGGTESSIAVLREGLAILGRETTETGRRIRAAKLGLPKDLLAIFDIPKDQRDRLLKAGADTGKAIDPELRKLRAERDAQQTRIDTAEERAMREREKTYLAVSRRTREAETRNAEFVAGGGVFGWIGRQLRLNKAQAVAPGDAQNQALQDNTFALRQLSKEFAGGGPRTAGAVPSGLRGTALQQALEAQGFQFGAFDVHTRSQ